MHTSTKAGNPDDIALGRALIAAGKVGCVVLAGGDGSRLGWDGPKGTFPLSLVKQKTLFQMLKERVEAASRHFEYDLKCALMTSPNNQEVTREAFPENIDLFSQNVIPLLDMDKKPLPHSRPNGNGEVLHCFYSSGLFEKWKAAGIEYVQTILIDNPLAEPFDPNQIGFHFKKRADATIKAVERLNPSENVGVIGIKDGKVCIVEYCENPPEDWNLANTSLFSFSMSFIEKVKDVQLPLHEIKKFYHGKPIFKRECFIFDLLPHADKTEVLLYPREEIFAPLKSREDVGPVQRALLERDRSCIQKLTGKMPKQIFELDPHFHYPTEALKEKWQKADLPPTSYIEP
ncbi:MAG: putative uridylyltransferase [Chlamydiae bacterium]|nr:putative uridylyltransferase [Chlamydiota bacterium]